MFALFDNLGTFELILCGVAGLLVFGRRLPEVAAQAGSTLAKFKKSLDGAVAESGVENEIRKIQQALPTDVSVRDVARAAAKKMESRMREVGAPPLEADPAGAGATPSGSASSDAASAPAEAASNSRDPADDAGARAKPVDERSDGVQASSSLHAHGTIARGSLPPADPRPDARDDATARPSTTPHARRSSAWGTGIDPASGFRGTDDAARE